jgi:hypothetical protein
LYWYLSRDKRLKRGTFPTYSYELKDIIKNNESNLATSIVLWFL